MKFARKLCLTAAAGILGVTLLGMSAPASAHDSSWGCGGLCRTAP